MTHIKNSTCPGLFSTSPAKFSLALASGRALVSQPAIAIIFLSIEMRIWHLTISADTSIGSTILFKGLITVRRELRQQHPSDLLSGRPRWTTYHEGVVAVTPSRPWSILIITWQTTLYEMYLRQNTFKISTKSSAVAYLPPLWRHTSLLNDGNCSFTHPVAVFPKGFKVTSAKMGNVGIFYVCHFHFTSAKLKKKIKSLFCANF